MNLAKLAVSLKPLWWLLLLSPLSLLVSGAFNLPIGYSLGANPVNFFIDELGLWGLRFLMVTLCVSPLRELTHSADWLRLRRLLGLFGFFYISVHVVFYMGVDLRFSLKALLDDIAKYPWILVGFLGWVLMMPLAATSFNKAMRRLKKRWQQLHYLVYPAVLLGCWHFFWQVKKDKTEPLVYVAIYVALMACRLTPIKQALRRLHTTQAI